MPDTLAIVAFINKAAMLDAINGAIDAESDDKAVLDPAGRSKREQQVLSDILKNDRLEAAITWAALEAQLPCEFRQGIASEAVLQCRVIPAPAKPASPGSSPERTSWLQR